MHRNTKSIILIAFSLVLVIVLNFSASNKKTVFADSDFCKYTSNTMLGTSKMYDGSFINGNEGSYVYYGKFKGTPIKFRVLDKNSTKYGGSTMLLDCDSILYKDYFDKDKLPNPGGTRANEWEFSDLREHLNGRYFLTREDGFTEVESKSIFNSVIPGHEYENYNSESGYKYYVGLTGEKVFILDYEEWKEYQDRNIKYFNDTVGDQWLRTAKEQLYSNVVYPNIGVASVSTAYIGYNNELSYFGTCDQLKGVSPAMNIDLSSVLFSSVLSGKIKDAGAGSEYKLTLVDDEITMDIPDASKVYKRGIDTGISYKISGSRACKVNSIYVLITDKPYDDNNATLLHYSKISKDLSGDFLESTAEFWFPTNVSGKWGKDYHVYLIAEINNDCYETDYASIPCEVPAPNNNAGIYNVDINDISNGSARLVPAIRTGIPSNYSYFVGEPIQLWLFPDEGYELDKITFKPEGESTIDITNSDYFIMPDKNVKINVSFKKKEYSIALNSDANGTSSVSSSKAVEGTTISVSAKPNIGYEIDKIIYRYDGNAGIDITDKKSFSMPGYDVSVQVTFKKISYSVRLDETYNGTASVSLSNATKDTPISISVNPNDGYELDKITYTPEGENPIDISSTKSFVMPAKNITVKVLFKRIESDNSASAEMSFEDFVERLYVVALERDSEPDGKAYWCGKVKDGTFDGAYCARFFLTSPEFLGKNKSDGEFVDTLYRTFFGRDADDEGRAFWVKKIKESSKEAVVEGFINSEEWCNICASYGVRSGAQWAKASVASKNATDFASRLYTKCLGRDAEEGGLKYWSLALTNLEITGSQAAREFFYSDEFKGFNTSNEVYVVRMYETFMGREPEGEGKAYWIDYLNKGGSRDEMFNFFSTCPEFTEICASYSIER